MMLKSKWMQRLLIAVCIVCVVLMIVHVAQEIRSERLAAYYYEEFGLPDVDGDPFNDLFWIELLGLAFVATLSLNILLWTRDSLSKARDGETEEEQDAETMPADDDTEGVNNADELESNQQG